jgi:hypothetical protein
MSGLVRFLKYQILEMNNLFVADSTASSHASADSRFILCDFPGLSLICGDATLWFMIIYLGLRSIIDRYSSSFAQANAYKNNIREPQLAQ